MSRPPALFCVFLLFVSATPAGLAADRLADVTRHGVRGDGTTLNTAAIQQVIDTYSAQGGGVLVFPAGRYLTGTIQLKDNITLRLEAQAVLLGSTNATDYRNVDPFIDGTGAELGYALVVAVGARHVGLEGPGTIDGQGAALRAAQTPYVIRPFLVRWVRCTEIVVRDVQLRNAGAWTMHFFQSKAASVARVTIRSQGLANNDGIDIDSCENVRIEDCDIDTGDDAICLKATSPQPCRDITVTGCTLTSHCATIKMGTESLGDFERIRISHCNVLGARLGGIKLFSVDGAHVRDVIISDITMTNVAVPVMMRLGARLKTFRASDESKPPGTLRDVTIRNLHATHARQLGLLISGIPGHSIENLTFENIDLQLEGGGKAEDVGVLLPEQEAAYPEIRMFGPTMPAFGAYLRHVRGVVFQNVRISVITPDARPEKIFIDVSGVTPSGFATPPEPAGPPS